MTSTSRQKTRSGKGFSRDKRRAEDATDIIVFVDEPDGNSPGICHAQKVAGAFGGKVVLVHVQCRDDDGNDPIDPVEWDIRKQKSRRWLDEMARCANVEHVPCEAQLLEGHCLSQIKSFLAQHQGDIAAALRTPHDKDWKLSETAWGVLLSRSAGVLMIPQDSAIDTKKKYDRILVPLDGSARAEIALPTAVTLAMAEAAELVLCHVAPKPGLSEFGANDQEAERLRDQICKRNEKAGKNYLARIKNRLARDSLRISVRISSDGDARRALIDIIREEQADFAVMATHGESGHRDVPTGDVARHILDRANIPVLLMRPKNGRAGAHVFGKPSSDGVRQPVGTD